MGLRLFALLLAAVITPAAAAGGFTPYFNRAAWEAAVGPFHTITFTEVPHPSLITNQYAAIGANFVNGTHWTYMSGAFPTDGVGVSGFDAITVDFSPPMNYIGMEYPGLMQAHFYSGGVLIYSTDLYGGGGSGFFVGFASTVPFDRAVLARPSGFGNTLIDNLSFGFEPAGGFTSASPLGQGASEGVRVRGSISPAQNTDIFAFTGRAGDRVYTALATGSSGADTFLRLAGPEPETTIEFDNDDGSSGATSSSIAGATLPADGTYYLVARALSAASIITWYDLYVRVRSGGSGPKAESEPNDAIPQPLPAHGWIGGATSANADFDRYALELNAGDTLWVSLDLDPERDGTSSDGQLAVSGGGLSGALVVNDTTASPPASESLMVTVRDPGTYVITVSAPPGSSFGSYHLSARAFLAAAPVGKVTTYSSTRPAAIPAGPALASSTITIPDEIRIAKITLALDLEHARMPDLDVRLLSPRGNEIVLFTNVGLSAQPALNLVLDDDAAVPIGVFPVYRGVRCQTEFFPKLQWLYGTRAKDTWTLFLHDSEGANGGTLHGWSIIIEEAVDPFACADPPPPPDAGNGLIVYSSAGFEQGPAGFTHGISDEWELGFPTYMPLAGCNSGANCWKTDLNSTYNGCYGGTCVQDLLSPPIDLTSVTPPIVLEWAQKYQLESPHDDHVWVEVRPVTPDSSVSACKVWEWTGPFMRQTIGWPLVTVGESAGWQLMHADLSDFAGETIEVRFHLERDTTTTTQQAGFAIDDVSVVAPCAAPLCPASINGDNVVDVNDLLALIGVWGATGGPADINDDGLVDVNDLLILIGAWGDC